jgi:hypothetical protein
MGDLEWAFKRRKEKRGDGEGLLGKVISHSAKSVVACEGWMGSWEKANSNLKGV